MAKKSLTCALKGKQKLFFLHLGKAASCCKDKHKDLINLDSVLKEWEDERIRLEKGERLPNCQQCWNNEDNGIQSYRQHNQKNISDTYEFFFDNACNQMCSYCGPEFSTTWGDNISKFGPFKNISRSELIRQNWKKNGQDSNEFLSQIIHHINYNVSDPVNVGLLGGEPLMQRRAFDILTKLDPTKIENFEITTNLNPPNNKFLKELIDMYGEKLSLRISIDTRPDFNNIPRANFNQTRFLDNLDLIRRKKIKHHVLSTVSILSVPTLPEFIDWYEDAEIPVSFQQISTPECLRPVILPTVVKKFVLDRINNRKIDKLISSELINSKVNTMRQIEQYNFIKQYFERTGIDIRKINIYKDFFQLLTENYKRITNAS